METILTQNSWSNWVSLWVGRATVSHWMICSFRAQPQGGKQKGSQSETRNPSCCFFVFFSFSLPTERMPPSPWCICTNSLLLAGSYVAVNELTETRTHRFCFEQLLQDSRRNWEMWRLGGDKIKATDTWKSAWMHHLLTHSAALLRRQHRLHPHRISVTSGFHQTVSNCVIVLFTHSG